ncbi:hypothetical protein [Rhizobium leucaenae]|uniref:Uncharacterized protein n=1 Tax=Rhizobium leucaenae TaxID=29450 RepID=A0A7W6ZZZ5_9HYPH|nr:hypothetical protein [Rhizobium leucaenae]MBB4571273.1 hypothetical protein [Rhizobium leucaenae]MBB6304896.1 hypothetical protein [Rhizobium leucaenae]
MLSPVSAVSALATAPEKPAVATAETSSVQTAATPLAVLPNTVTASVEGKLNMLLAAARERMFDSLLSVIDDAGAALNVSREPDESSAALAQRLVDTIRSLPPQQLAAAQQLMDAQAQTPLPLPLIAEALANPDGPEAVQIAINLDATLTPEPDAVMIKAVVNSYGQNAGETEMIEPQAQVPAQTIKRTPDVAPAAALAALPASPASAAAPAPAAAAILAAIAAQVPEETPVAIAPAQAVLVAAAILEPELLPNPETASTPQTIPNQQSAPRPLAASALLIDAGNGEAVHPQNAIPVAGNTSSATPTEEKLPTEIALIRSPITPPPVPRDIQQIRADIKEGLQVVIGRALEVTGPELLQIIHDNSSAAENIIAQALAANADDQKDVPLPPQTSANEDTRKLAATMASQNAVSTDEVASAPAALQSKPLGDVPGAPAMNMPDGAAQMGTPVPLPPGIPFAIAQYLPVDVSIEEKELERVDRVDPADDEEHEQGQGGETAQDESEDDSQPEETHQPTASAPEEADAETAPPETSAVAPEPLALPAPAPRDSLHDHAFDFYQRMVEWE